MNASMLALLEKLKDENHWLKKIYVEERLSFELRKETLKKMKPLGKSVKEPNRQLAKKDQYSFSLREI